MECRDKFPFPAFNPHPPPLNFTLSTFTTSIKTPLIPQPSHPSFSREISKSRCFSLFFFFPCVSLASSLLLMGPWSFFFTRKQHRLMYF